MSIQEQSAKPTHQWGWAIIGTGNIASKFAHDLQYVPSAKKSAVFSRSQDSADKFAAQFGFANAHSDLSQLNTAANIDIVYIATPHVAHVEQALACIDAGKAVLIEKPIAMSAADVKTIEDAAKAKGVFVMEAMWSRFLPAVQRAKAILDSGELGKPLRAEASLHYDVAFQPENRLFAPNLGGGVLHDLGVYPISVSSFLLGEPKLMESMWQAAPNGVNNNAQLMLECGCTPSFVQTSFNHEGENSFIVYCEKGVLRIDRHFLRADSLTVWNEPRESVPSSSVSFLAKLRTKLKLHGGKTQRFERLGTGLHYQAAAVQAALGQNLTSHPTMPLVESAQVLNVIEQVLEKKAVS